MQVTANSNDHSAILESAHVIEKMKKLCDNALKLKEANVVLNSFKKYNLTSDIIRNKFIEYDFDVMSFSNEIYDAISMNIVLYLHNIMPGSWHQLRQMTIIDFLKTSNAKNIVDIGFGAPTKYMKILPKNNAEIRITLVDYHQNALILAEHILRQWHDNYEKIFQFKVHDMESYSYIGNYDVYILQDSVEHIRQPDLYLRKLINESPKNAKFIISLPIGDIIPSHYMAWTSVSEAIAWINSFNLKITKSKLINVNPEVDLFARNLNLKDFYMLCEK